MRSDAISNDRSGQRSNLYSPRSKVSRNFKKMKYINPYNLEGLMQEENCVFMWIIWSFIRNHSIFIFWFSCNRCIFSCKIQCSQTESMGFYTQLSPTNPKLYCWAFAQFLKMISAFWLPLLELQWELFLNSALLINNLHTSSYLQVHSTV